MLSATSLSTQSGSYGGVYSHTIHAPKYKRITVNTIHSMTQDATLISRMESKAASQNVHEEYCRVLNIDIPLYHTTEVAPAVPFTLHLAHHTLSSDTVGNKYLLRKGNVDPLQNKENGQLYLSMLDDCNNTIYSSELIQESTIGKIQMFLK